MPNLLLESSSVYNTKDNLRSEEAWNRSRFGELQIILSCVNALNQTSLVRKAQEVRSLYAFVRVDSTLGTLRGYRMKVGKQQWIQVCSVVTLRTLLYPCVLSSRHFLWKVWMELETATQSKHQDHLITETDAWCFATWFHLSSWWTQLSALTSQAPHSYLFCASLSVHFQNTNNAVLLSPASFSCLGSGYCQTWLCHSVTWRFSHHPKLHVGPLSSFPASLQGEGWGPAASHKSSRSAWLHLVCSQFQLLSVFSLPHLTPLIYLYSAYTLASYPAPRQHPLHHFSWYSNARTSFSKRLKNQFEKISETVWPNE